MKNQKKEPTSESTEENVTSHERRVVLIGVKSLDGGNPDLDKTLLKEGLINIISKYSSDPFLKSLFDNYTGREIEPYSQKGEAPKCKQTQCMKGSGLRNSCCE